MTIPPIERSIDVSWKPEEAFRRFTGGFASWWPTSTHSIGGSRVKRVSFECEVGGRIYEELQDGRRFQWGRVTAWEPPGRVAFTWHPSRDESVAQDVEVRFLSEGTGTRVVLTSSGWEKLGAKARRARKGYSLGWAGILSVFAGKTAPSVLLFAAISHGITFFLKVTGRLEGEIAKAGGRMS
jgi:uncharacterized protein YndB with AHSA1/START domain